MKSLNDYRVLKYDVYFYTFRTSSSRSSKINACVYKGDIFVRKGSPISKTFDPIFRSNDYTFESMCKTEEGAIWHNAFWLNKRNDAKALDIFKKHVDDLIKEERKKIRRYQNRFKYVSSHPIKSRIG